MVSVLALSVTFGATLFPFWHFVPPPPAGGVCLSEGASGEEEKLSGMPKPPSLREGDRVSGGRSNTPLSKTSKNSIIYGILKKGRNIE